MKFKIKKLIVLVIVFVLMTSVAIAQKYLAGRMIVANKNTFGVVSKDMVEQLKQLARYLEYVDNYVIKGFLNSGEIIRISNDMMVVLEEKLDDISIVCVYRSKDKNFRSYFVLTYDFHNNR